VQIIKPYRIRHHYTQTLIAPPERVFPLLCPVRETDWAPGWAPSLVVSESGIMEAHCMFVTPDKATDAIWIATRHDPQALSLELWKIVPGQTACRFDITLNPIPEERTAASIAYTCTALGPAGNVYVEQFTTDRYEEFMQHWEQSLNYYLEHGTMIDTQRPV
jgi:hypothetical protein